MGLRFTRNNLVEIDDHNCDLVVSLNSIHMPLLEIIFHGKHVSYYLAHVNWNIIFANFTVGRMFALQSKKGSL